MPLLAILLALHTGSAATAEDPALASGIEPAESVPVEQVPAAPMTAPSGQYEIGQGDTIVVQVFGDPSLSGPFVVDDSGAIDFPLIGRVSVAGLTPAGVTTALRDRLMPDFLLNPSITVSVSAYRSQPVQVLGAVGKPGVYYLRGPTSLLQILGEAGGVSHGGVAEIRVTHGSLETVIPYDQLLAQQGNSLAVTKGDIITVPQSLVSVMGQVGKPGEIGFREGLTLSQCLAAAGGALPTADLGHVYILRGERRIRVSLRRILSGKQADVIVQPGDRIFVPESVV